MTAITHSNMSPLDPASLAEVQRRMRGELLVLGGAVDHQQPALIAHCLHARDVALAINLAHEGGLDITVGSGDHSVTNNCMSAGSLLIDLSQMRQIVVDPLQQIARVQPGVTPDEIVRAAAAYGLVTSGTILAVEVVTAVGTLITTSAAEHADLFQAFRDGGTIGVVTAITYQLYPLSIIELTSE